MDTIERYRQIVRAVLTEVARVPYATTEIQHETVFDRDTDRYIVMTVGWELGKRRIYFPLVQLDLMGGKVWIQHDNTEYGVADDLEAAGIPKSDIVLAFHPPHVRPLTGYAVA